MTGNDAGPSRAPRRRSVLLTAGLVALGFLAGWAVRPASLAHAQGGPEAGLAHEVGATTNEAPAAPTCADPLAMEANRNLTAQVQDYQGKWRSAEAAEQAALARLATAEGRSKLAIPADEWSRMSREGVFRLRIPCASWDAPARVEIRAPSATRLAGARTQLQPQRAEAAGFSQEELETLAQVYKRTHAKLWQRIASACPAALRDPSHDVDGAPSDRDKVASCRADVLQGRLPSTWAAMDRVAQEQAARTKGGGSAATTRGAPPEAVVLSALASSPDELEEEMIRSLGREKATRAVEWGLTCFDETILRAPSKTDGS